MAEKEDLTKAATDAIKQPISWAKKNPWAMALLVLVVGVLVLRMSGKIQAYLSAKASSGSKLWGTVAKIAGVAVAVLAVLAVTDAYGAWGTLPLVAAVFPLSDYVALRDEAGNRESILTPGDAMVDRMFRFQAPKEVYGAFPIRARSIHFSLTAELTQPASNGSAIPWDALANLCAGLDIRSPRFGMLLRKEDSPGMVLKHMDEFISRAYNYSGDEVLVDISSAQGEYEATIYFAHCFEQRWADNPSEFEWFVGWLQNTELRFWLAKSDILDDLEISLGCDMAAAKLRVGYRYGIGAVHGDVRGAYHVPPVVNRKIYKKPAAGQTDIPFEGVGVGGPENTVAPAGERIVAALYLSNVLGMPGAGPVNDIVEIGCEAFGFGPTENVDQYLAAKLPDLPRQLCRSNSEGTNSTAAGWPWTLNHQGGTGNLLDEDDLLAMPLVLPEVGCQISKLPRYRGPVELHARRSTPPSSGQHCLYVHSLRDVDPEYAIGMLRAAGISGPTTRATDGDADAEVAAGRVRPASMVGIPQIIKGSK